MGISFFTFQQLSYIIDAYKGKRKGYHFIEYALFIIFFPQFVDDPIVLHNELISLFRDQNRKKVNYENLSVGITMFTYGLFKKIMIVDVLGSIVVWGLVI